MTLEQITANLITKNPTLKIGSDQTGYLELTGADYDAVITQWAKAVEKKQAEAAEKIQLINKKAALLERLGMTADEAALLFA